MQGLYGHLALEYVVEDHPGAAIELDPGVYFQDHISGNAFDIPGRAYVSFPLKKDKIFATVGFGWGQFQDPVVAPGGGFTWLINDKLRLQAVFPKPALVYQPNDDWDIGQLGNSTFSELAQIKCIHQSGNCNWTTPSFNTVSIAPACRSGIRVLSR